jgi:hypothetical protein
MLSYKVVPKPVRSACRRKGKRPHGFSRVSAPPLGFQLKRELCHVRKGMGDGVTVVAQILKTAYQINKQ